MTESLEIRVRMKILELVTAFADENKLGKPSYEMEDTLEALGFGSIEAASLIIDLEDEFQVNFDALYKIIDKRERSNACYDHKIRIGEIVNYILQQKHVEAASSTVI